MHILRVLYLSLCAAVLATASAAHADNRYGKADGDTLYAVDLSPRLILPPVIPIAPGTVRDLQVDDVVLRTQLGWMYHAKIVKDVKVAVGGIPFAIDAQESLRRVIRFSGGELDAIDPEAPAFCQRYQLINYKDLAEELGIGRVDARMLISKAPQLCLIDTDSNGAADHAFIIGLRKVEDQALIPIEDVTYFSYTADDNFAQNDGDYIEVVYDRKGAFETRVYLNGLSQPTVAYRHWDLETRERFETDLRQLAREKSIPQRMNFTNAAIKITAFDKETKAITIEHLRDFEYAPLTLVVTGTCHNCPPYQP